MTQLAQYLSEPVIVRTEHSLLWCRLNKERLPDLARLARVYLGPPPTNVPSERLFIVTDEVISDHRGALSPDNVSSRWSSLRLKARSLGLDLHSLIYISELSQNWVVFVLFWEKLHKTLVFAEYLAQLSFLVELEALHIYKKLHLKFLEQILHLITMKTIGKLWFKLMKVFKKSAVFGFSLEHA